MRVVSQDGTLDMPYEMTSIFRNNNNVYCEGIGEEDGCVMGRYSTEEKAKKAMEELRCAYMCHSLLKMGQTPPDGIDEKLTIGLSGAFQFPAEEELE